jgi:hypothetical protein
VSLVSPNIRDINVINPKYFYCRMILAELEMKSATQTITLRSKTTRRVHDSNED